MSIYGVHREFTPQNNFLKNLPVRLLGFTSCGIDTATLSTGLVSFDPLTNEANNSILN